MLIASHPLIPEDVDPRQSHQSMRKSDERWAVILGVPYPDRQMARARFNEFNLDGSCLRECYPHREVGRRSPVDDLIKSAGSIVFDKKRANAEIVSPLVACGLKVLNNERTLKVLAGKRLRCHVVVLLSMNRGLLGQTTSSGCAKYGCSQALYRTAVFNQKL